MGVWAGQQWEGGRRWGDGAHGQGRLTQRTSPAPDGSRPMALPSHGLSKLPTHGPVELPTRGPIEHHPRPATMLPHAWAGFRWWLRRAGLKQSVGTAVAARASMSDGEGEREEEIRVDVTLRGFANFCHQGAMWYAMSALVDYMACLGPRMNHLTRLGTRMDDLTVYASK